MRRSSAHEIMFYELYWRHYPFLQPHPTDPNYGKWQRSDDNVRVHFVVFCTNQFA